LAPSIVCRRGEGEDQELLGGKQKRKPKAFFIEIFIQVNSLYLCSSIYRSYPGVRPKPESIKHNYSRTTHHWVLSDKIKAFQAEYIE